MPRALPLSFGGNTDVIIADVIDISMPAPIAWKARIIINIYIFTERLKIAEDIEKVKRPY
ncbi:hypothetical protein JCM16816_08780 [Thermoanaerobacter brockii subsp. lactiethylicus]